MIGSKAVAAINPVVTGNKEIKIEIQDRQSFTSSCFALFALDTRGHR
jgi:hypothetical protein